eukprot:UN1186
MSWCHVKQRVCTPRHCARLSATTDKITTTLPSNLAATSNPSPACWHNSVYDSRQVLNSQPPAMRTGAV